MAPDPQAADAADLPPAPSTADPQCHDAGRSPDPAVPPAPERDAAEPADPHEKHYEPL